MTTATLSAKPLNAKVSADAASDAIMAQAAPACSAALNTALAADLATMLARDGEIWNEVNNFKRTRMAWQRFNQLGILCRAVIDERIPGDYAEFGIWRGGAVYLVAKTWATLDPTRAVLGFDSFQGLPAPDGRLDGPAIRAGLFDDVSYDEINSFFAQRGLRQVHLIKGWFEQTIHHLSGRTLAIAHIDADCYESVKCVLEPAWDALSPGGYLICDDYRHPECAGATVAMEEFFARRPEVIRQTPGVDCGCFVRKLP